MNQTMKQWEMKQWIRVHVAKKIKTNIFLETYDCCVCNGVWISFGSHPILPCHQCYAILHHSRLMKVLPDNNAVFKVGSEDQTNFKASEVTIAIKALYVIMFLPTVH